MKYTGFSIMVLVLLVSCSALQAKDRTYRGRVTDKNNRGLANVALQARERNELFFCNAKGYFSITVNPDTIDAFEIKCPGYYDKTLWLDEVGDDSIFVKLETTNTVLKSAKVAAKGGTLKQETIGISGGSHNTGCYMMFKDELALFLPAQRERNGILKEIGAYITKEGAKDSKFIMHVYTRDSATGAPGDDITDSVLAVQADRGNEWVTADLGDKLIQMKGGVFVSVEWTLGYGNDYYTWDLRNASNYYSGDDSLRKVYNGQVLGLAWGNSRQPIVYRRYAHNIYDHTNEDKWFRTPPLRGGRRFNEWITPMIYCTYSYFEK